MKRSLPTFVSEVLLARLSAREAAVKGGHGPAQRTLDGRVVASPEVPQWNGPGAEAPGLDASGVARTGAFSGIVLSTTKSRSLLPRTQMPLSASYSQEEELGWRSNESPSYWRF